jgi:hypothetical protein
MTSRSNAGVAAVTLLVFDLDRVPPDHERLKRVCWIGHTTWSNRSDAPRWRLVVPLQEAVAVERWADVWRRARMALCPEADPSCKDPSRQYYLPCHQADAKPEAIYHAGPLLDPATLPELPPEPARAPVPATPPLALRRMQRAERGEHYMAGVISNLETVQPGGRNAALNHAAWTLGRWVAVGELEQTDVENALYAAATRIGLVSDDGERQVWSTLRSGLGAGLREPIELNAQGK